MKNNQTMSSYALMVIDLTDGIGLPRPGLSDANVLLRVYILNTSYAETLS